MGTRSNPRYPYEPDTVFPPGETLAEWLDERDMTQAELAARTGLSTKHVNQIVKGAAPITTETALGLERVTGIPAHLWNSLEMSYRSHLTCRAEQERLADDAEWLEQLPVGELVKRRRIERRAAVAERVIEICTFFGVANPAAWRNMWQQPDAAYRASQAYVKDPGAVAAWLRIGEIEATKIDCAPFSKSALLAVVDELRGLTNESDPGTWVRTAQALCASAGVAFVVEQEIARTRLNGATRWLSPSKALVQISTRHKRHDISWFTLFHEIGHVLLHSKKGTFINDGEEQKAGGVEKEADAYAQQVLIPREHEATLGTLHTNEDVERFATAIGIAPGIVVGRLQYMGWWKHSEGNDLRWPFDWPPKP